MLRTYSFTTLRGIFRQKRSDHVFVLPQVNTGSRPEYMSQVAKWVETIFFRRFSEAMINSSCAGAGNRRRE